MSGRTWALVIGLVACSSALGACGSGAGVNGASTTAAAQVVTAAQARAAIETYDSVDTKALATCSSTLNDSVETGDLALIDDVGSINPPACTPSTTPPQTSITVGTVVVPAQTHFPAAFLRMATVDNGLNHGPLTNLWVMQLTGPGAPWKAQAQVKLFAQAPAFSNDAHGYAPEPLDPAASAYALTPTATCAAAAQFFNSGYAGTALATPMTADPTIAGFISALRSSDQTAKSSDGTLSQRTWTCGGNVFAEPAKDGSALVVFTLAGSYGWTDFNGYSVYVGPDHKDSGGQIQLLAPGSYTAVNETDKTIVAALVPRKGSGAAPQLIGQYEGLITATGT